VARGILFVFTQHHVSKVLYIAPCKYREQQPSS